jgi:hypothetical protein
MMIEFKEILRLWQKQVPKKPIAGLGSENGSPVSGRGRSGWVASAYGDVQQRAGA